MVFRTTTSDTMLDRSSRYPHLTASERGKSGELRQLWEEVQRLALMGEGKVAVPFVERISASVLSQSLVNAAILIEGRGFIPSGWNQARLNVDTGVANSGIDWIAVQPGEAGNNVTIEYVVGVGALAVAVVGNAVTVTLAAVGSAANAIIAAVAASATVSAVVQPVNEFGSTGVGVIILASAAANLAGGTGRALRRAFLDVNPAGANNGIRYESRVPGLPGNDVTIAYTVGGVGVAPIVTVVGKAVSVSVDVGVTTALQVIAAINESAAAKRLVSARLLYGETGAGTFAGAVAAAALANGADGTAVRFVAGGLAGTFSNITDTTATVSVAALAESAVDEIAMVELDICGYVFEWQAAVVV